MTFKKVNHRNTWMLEKWRPVLCARIRDQPSSRGLLHYINPFMVSSITHYLDLQNAISSCKSRFHFLPKIINRLYGHYTT
jgi:hypothetical protein